jgi:metal-dependent amidase/aminoacylase/carboxypeptidase family protein
MNGLSKIHPNPLPSGRALPLTYLEERITWTCFATRPSTEPFMKTLKCPAAALVASHLYELHFDVTTGIGGHGVVGIFRNGPGKAVLIRTELDVLPIEEEMDVSYKSTKMMLDRYGQERPSMHACGHDMSMAALLGASELLKAERSQWGGTLIILFQSDEEEIGGAQAMIEFGLYDKIPVPDVLLGQYMTVLPAGYVAIKPGSFLVASDSVNIGGDWRALCSRCTSQRAVYLLGFRWE